MSITTRLTPTERSFLLNYRNASVYLILFSAYLPSLIFLLNAQANTRTALVDASGSLAWQVLDVFMFFNAILVARLFNVSIQHILKALLPAALLIFWMFLSIGWSDYPDLTLRRGLRTVIELVSLILLALSLQSRDDLLRIFFRAFLVILALDLASLAFPSVSFSPFGFSGIHGHKNAAGDFSSEAFVVFAIGFFDRSASNSRLIAIIAALAALFILYISHSRTSLFAVVIAVILVFFTHLAASGNRMGRVSLPAFYILIVGMLGLSLIDETVSDLLAKLFGDPTLTGRDQMWRFAFYKLDNNPLGGVGYGALWQVGPQLEAYLKNAGVEWVANQAHNGYIDILAQLGYVGLACLIFYLVLTFGWIMRYVYNVEHKIFGLGYYAVFVFWETIFKNITESTWFRSGTAMFLIVLVSTNVAGHLFRNRASDPLRNPTLGRRSGVQS